MVEPLNTKAWVLVPVEPTPAMVEAHYQAHAEAETVFADAQLVWAKMLSASPSLPVVDGGEVVATSWKYHDRVYVDFKFAPDPYALERGFLTDIEPLVRQSALLAAESRVLSLEEEVKRLRRLGDTLSCITFNLAQPSSPLTNDQKAAMREAFTQWDAGRQDLSEGEQNG